MVRRVVAISRQAAAQVLDRPHDDPVRWRDLVRPMLLLLMAPVFELACVWVAVDPPEGTWPLRLILPALGVIAAPLIFFCGQYTRSELRRAIEQLRDR